MEDLIRGFTIDEYVHVTGSLIFEVRNCLVGCVGYGELAQKELEPSHPAFTPCCNCAEIGGTSLRRSETIRSRVLSSQAGGGETEDRRSRLVAAKLYERNPP